MIIISALGSILTVSCSNLEEKPKEQSMVKFPDSIIEKANIVLTSEGKREAIINADTLIVFDKEDSTIAKNVKVDFYDEDGNYRSTMTSKEGLVRQKQQYFTAWGDVVVDSDSSRLLTQSLLWDPLRKLILTDDFVELHRGKDVLTGYGMEADNKLENVRILRDVKGRISEIPQSEQELDSLEGEPEKEIVP